MAELTPLAISVLALLHERPMHAYEMYQLLISRQNDRIVKVRPGSLYHTVERLAGQEYVRATGTERAGNRPERTTYEITPAGAEALRRRVESGIEKYVYEYPLFPVVLSEAHNLDAEDARAAVPPPGRGPGRLAGRARRRARPAPASDGVHEPYWIGGAYVRSQIAAERDWLATTIERIESKDLPWQPRKNT